MLGGTPSFTGQRAETARWHGMRQHRGKQGPQVSEGRHGVAACMPHRTTLLDCPAGVQHCIAAQTAGHDNVMLHKPCRAELQRVLILLSLSAGRGGCS